MTEMNNGWDVSGKIDNWVDNYMFACFVEVCVSQSYGQPSQGILVYLILGLEATDLPTGLLIVPLLIGCFNLNLLLPQFSLFSAWSLSS